MCVCVCVADISTLVVCVCILCLRSPQRGCSCVCLLCCCVTWRCPAAVLCEGVGGRAEWEEGVRGRSVRTAWQPAGGTPGREGSHRPQPPGLDRASRFGIKHPAGPETDRMEEKEAHRGQVEMMKRGQAKEEKNGLNPAEQS